MSTTTLAPALRMIPAGPVTFEIHFEAARAAVDIVAEMTSPFTHTPGTNYLVSADGLSGFAIRPDGELVMVFSTVRGRGDALIEWAILAGAKFLDCFDGYLPTLYARHGFRETTREANWTPGGPDVIYMSL